MSGRLRVGVGLWREAWLTTHLSAGKRVAPKVYVFWPDRKERENQEELTTCLDSRNSSLRTSLCGGCVTRN